MESSSSLPFHYCNTPALNVLTLATLAIALLVSAQTEASEAEESLQKSGTGFFVSQRGHIVTNHHVVDNCASIRVVTGGKQKELALIGSDEKNDLAVLQMAGQITDFARFREGRSIRPGDSVVAVGFPLHKLLASEANVTTGTVSALAGLKNDARFLQMTAPVQPGNSGGPLLDQSGLIVGIVEGKLNALALAIVTGDIPQNINFAINAAVTKAFLDSHNIHYETTSPGKKLDPADIGEQAKRFTVLLQCYSETLEERRLRLAAEREAQKQALDEKRRFLAEQEARKHALEQEEKAREREAEIKAEADRQAAEHERVAQEKEAARLARLEDEAHRERTQRLQAEERARRAKAEAERQAYNADPETVEKARRKGQEARAKVAGVDKEIPQSGTIQEVERPTPIVSEASLTQPPIVKLSPYWSQVEAIIKRHWEPPRIDVTGQTYSTVVRFRFYRNGTVKDVAIEQTSGNSYFDMAAQQAILRPRIFPPFPSDITEAYKDVSMVFRTGDMTR